MPIRSSFRMRVELDDHLPEPAFPDELEVRVMRPGEERAVHAAANDAFADHWSFHPDTFESWRQWNLDRDGSRPDLWWLALDGDEIAGICLNHFADDGAPRHGYVHILGVRGPWRREETASFMLLAKSCHDLDWLQYVVGKLKTHGNQRPSAAAVMP